MARLLPPPLATVKDISDNIGEPIETPEEIASCNSKIKIASSKARRYGLAWSDLDVPESVWGVVVEAASRGYMNPAGYESERGDTLNFRREKSFAEGVAFTDEEIETVEQAAGINRGGLTSLPVYRPDSLSNAPLWMAWGGERETFAPG